MTLTDVEVGFGPITFDPYDYAFQEDPYPTYARLRAESPLHYAPERDLWVLSRYDDIADALRQDQVYSNRMGVSIDKSSWNQEAHRVMSILAMDPPRQNKMRALVSRGFTPRRVKELGPSIQRLTEGYFDRVLDGEEIDWIADFAGKLPMDVISELMGVPVSDRDEVRRLADVVVHREEGVTDVPVAGIEASFELIAYYADMLKQRRAQPTEDLTSALLAAEIDGVGLSDEELIAFLFLMVVAGNETTTKLLGNAVFHLTQHPEQLAQLFTGQFEVGTWIEETLRFDTSTQMLARHLLEDLPLHGVVAPAGSQVVIALGSANRDERVFTQPDVFDLERRPDELAKSLSFGGGRHFCLGANLARLETTIVLDELVKRTSSISVNHDRAERVHSINVRGFKALPLRPVLR